jgi:hypothetical protein
VSDRVDAAVAEVQAPDLHPIGDRVAIQPGGEQLVAVDHPVLQRRPPSDLEIDGCGRLS